jgi:hypothetical protein
MGNGSGSQIFRAYYLDMEAYKFDIERTLHHKAGKD